MHSLEPELRELHEDAVLDDVTASRAIALERRSVFSLFAELRAATYLAVVLLVTGLGMLVKENLERIGRLTLIAALALIAAACYASAIRTRLQGAQRSTVGDYVLLLGALVVSIDLGYSETQFHWLGANWSRHLLLLALLHAVTAYALDSRLVLSVALTSLAGWLGVERGFGSALNLEVFELDRAAPELGARALSCASVVIGWRAAHRRLRAAPQFDEVFDHFAANLAFWGALVLCFDERLGIAALLLLLALAAVSIRHGLRAGRESFVVYGVLYAAAGASHVTSRLIGEPLVGGISVLAIASGAVALLWRLHLRLQSPAP
jgi:hypothetical protein